MRTTATLPAPTLGEPRVPVGIVQISIVVGLTAVLATAGLVAGFDPLKAAGVAAGAGVIIGSLLSSEFGIAVLLATFAIFQRDGLDFAALPFFGGGIKPSDLMLFATLAGWAIRTIVRHGRMRSLPKVEVQLLLAFLAWATVGVLVGAAHDTVVKEGVTELRPLLHLLLFLCVATEFDRAAARRVAWLLMLLAVPLTIHAIVLYRQGIGSFNRYVGGVRVMDVEFGYLMFPVLLGVSFFMDGEGPSLIVLALAAIGFVGLSMTFYRMAFLGLAGGLLTLLYLANRRGRRVFVLGLWLVAAGTIAASAWFAEEGARGRDPVSALERRVASIGDYENNVSAQHRLHEWATARQMIAQHPILGNGMGARIGFHSPMFNPITNSYGFWSHDTYIHNVYLWLLTKLGFIGFALMLGFVVTALVHGARRIRHAPPETSRAVPAALIACIVALMISSFFGRILTLPTITPFVAYALGTLYILVGRGRDRRGGRGAHIRRGAVEDCGPRVNCLVLTPFVPYPAADGGRVRMYHLIRGLSARHRVDVLTLAEPTPESRAAVDGLRSEVRSWGGGPGGRVESVEHRLSRAGAAWRACVRGDSVYQTLYRSAAYQQALDAMLNATRYDVVQVEFVYMAQYRRSGRRPEPPRVLDEHNVEFRINATLAADRDSGAGAPALRGVAYNLYARREFAHRRTEELAACRGADHVLTVSEPDRAVLQEALPGLPVTVVPNGVDLAHFRPIPPAATDTGVVFVGKMDYRPNVRAAVWFCTEILPAIRRERPDCPVTIVGAQPTAAVRALERLPGVTVTGAVPDTRPYVSRAAVTVVPIRAGSGTRLKILEALALGRAVVSTTAGCEGLNVVDGEQLLVADEPDLFARHVVRLLGDVAERERLGAAGRRLVEARYGWDAAVATVERVYAAVTRTSASPPEADAPRPAALVGVAS